ncbi:MTR [Branchiostoma lanceolatum]|uniref:MTR protein n=1 Tax=Branchiostoma lanceolatum TaxID=7740 RepID=A0A8J9Z0C6_BRALA|nr:MTR [Branchiostoma lanceolatum]
MTMTTETKVLDGGLATELDFAGFDINDDPLWSARLLATNSAAIKQVHKSFLTAGSDVIITSTYQASVPGFQEYLGVSVEEAHKLMDHGVRIAKQACQEFCKEQDIGDSPDRRNPLAAGSVGPYGACLHDASEYTGEYVDSMSIEELQRWHRPRLGQLITSGADMVAIETIPALKEAAALVQLLREFPNTRAWVTFSCKDGLHTCHGESFPEALAAVLKSPQVFAAGANCCPPEHVAPLLQKARELCKDPAKFFIAYPNSGEKWAAGTGWHGKADCRPLSSYIPEWLDLGARWIGGCCRTRPDDIKDIRSSIEQWKKTTG